MKTITFPLKLQMKRPQVGDLQDALQLLLERGVLLSNDDGTRRELSETLKNERTEQRYGKATRQLVGLFQEEQKLPPSGQVDERTANALNALLERLGAFDRERAPDEPEEPDEREPREGDLEVHGTVRHENGQAAAGVLVRAYDLDLRNEELLGEARTGHDGAYRVVYSASRFRDRERRGPDLVVRATGDDGDVLATSPTLFNAPRRARVDLSIPLGRGPALFDRIDAAVRPLLGDLEIEDLEEDEEHHDLTFLAGETGFAQRDLARFVLAHRLAERGLPTEAWFAVMGGSLLEYQETRSVADHRGTVRVGIVAFDEAALGRVLDEAFAQHDVASSLAAHRDEWIEGFLALGARRALGDPENPTFLRLALDDSGIDDPERQEKLARRFNRYRFVSPQLVAELEEDPDFGEAEVADLRTSYQLADLTRGDFSVVRALKQDLEVRRPQDIRTLAKRSGDEWIDWTVRKRQAGEIDLPLRLPGEGVPPGLAPVSEAEIYGRSLERQLRSAFPTAAFTGGLERAIAGDGPRGIARGRDLGAFLDGHQGFELHRTRIDTFLDNGVDPDFREIAQDPGFRLELGGVQRVFKLAPTFEATDTLLADGVHSAQRVYRMGESAFVRRYEDQPGFTADSARTTWKRAHDTHAAVLTIVGDLQALDQEALPAALTTGNGDVPVPFPNWENLFRAGDLCHCEHCNSVLGPAAYFADLLMYLGDRKDVAPPGTSARDVLFRRRPDLEWLELDCDNAHTTLPYVDVVCEVLESAVDADDENELLLSGFTAVPADPDAARTAVIDAFEQAFQDPANDGKQKTPPGGELTVSQVEPTDPDRWVVHGDEATYLLKKKGGPDFFARLLPNTKATSEELRAYPAYVNPKAYATLREARFPSALPFDLFAEEVGAGFRKSRIERWDLMRTLRGSNPPNDPSDGDIAAEYFGISSDPGATFDEKRLILDQDTTVAGQKVLWGEPGGDWLDVLANVKTFLGKTGLEYEELLGLIDLPFVNPESELFIEHLDSSCDTDQKRLRGLDAEHLDRIHRFLRLWRKLDGWGMWELDLAIRHPAIGDPSPDHETLDEAFLVDLHHFERLRHRLGTKVTVEEACALMGDLNTETHFVEAHGKRGGGLYQSLFLNRRLIQPLDPAFEVDAVTGPPTETISGHRPAVLAAVRLREADLLRLEALTRPPPDGGPYINGDLTLTGLSFLWRHAWLSKLLKLGVAEWATLLKLHPEDAGVFTDPEGVLDLIEIVDHVKASGLSPDELDWVLAANRSARAALKEAAAARFLTALRTDLRALHTEYDPGGYDFLEPPADEERLTSLLTSLLSQLHRDEAGARFFLEVLRDQVALEAPVEGWPDAFDLPNEITDTIRIRLDNTTTPPTLRFTGLMTAAERTSLLKKDDPPLAPVTGIDAYQDAVEELFQRPRLALKFLAPVFTAPLEELSAAVDFGSLADPALRSRVTYEAEARRLRVVGVLTPAEREALHALSGDADYRTAVGSLFDRPRTGSFDPEEIWLEEADLQLPLRDLDDPSQDHLKENLAKAIQKALPYLSRILSEDLVVVRTSTELGLAEGLSHRLLTEYAVLPETLLEHLTGGFVTSSGALDESSAKATFDGWYWAHRTARVWREWSLTLPDWERLQALTASAQLLDYTDMPLDDTAAPAPLERFLNTDRLLRFRDRVPETSISFLEVVERLHTGATRAELAADVERMNEAWSAADVTALIDALDMDFPADYFLAESWERIHRAFSFLDRLHAGAATAVGFAAPAMDQSHARTLEELLRSRFGPETWLTLSAEIQDVLRERKRDALAAYLLNRPRPDDAPSGQWENTNDLYAYYLLDVEMSACQLTSRLVQASGSVQLFVQRCFMGLEPDVTVDADGDDGDSAWRWWKWMRKYRVWEANLKVFLWPEYFIQPELKPDRSPFFRDLENELLQNEITQETVEAAFASYLEKLDGVAQLEVAGFYQEDDGDRTVLHVFGRTTGAEPHLYYYRRYDYRQWTPWEKVDLDIQGDYLIPAVVGGRLYLFWPVFTEVPDEDKNTEEVQIPTGDEKKAKIKPAWKKLRMQMAVSDYRRGRWTPRRLSKDAVESKPFYVEIVRNHYRYIPVDRSMIDGRFFVQFDGYSTAPGKSSPIAALTGSFEIGGCTGVPVRSDFSDSFPYAVRPEVTSTGRRGPTFLEWREDPSRLGSKGNDLVLESALSMGSTGNNLALSILVERSGPVPVLARNPWLFRIDPPWHLSLLDRFLYEGSEVVSAFLGRERFFIRPILGSWLPFFYRDKKRTFFVLPSLGAGMTRNREFEAFGDLHGYYPEIKGFFRGLASAFEAEVRENLQGWTPSEEERTEIERFLEPRLPAWTEEGIADEGQLKELVVRLMMSSTRLSLGFWSLLTYQLRQFHFKSFYHPFVCDFARQIHDPLQGIPGLMKRSTQRLDSGFSFERHYRPTVLVVDPTTDEHYPRETVDFSPDGAYSPYNWELFFHAPLLIANSLSKHQRFKAAQDWYHYIFNPLGVEGENPGSPTSRYWITKPFYEATDQSYIEQRIESLLAMLAGEGDPSKKAELEKQVTDWREHPFEPHRIAAYRTVAYQKTVVMKYLDNLIAWGDQLFRQDSMESLNEATQLYVLAAEILGPRPKKIPPQAAAPPETFHELESRLDAFGNALVEVENLVPVQPGGGETGDEQPPLPFLYFCVPHNDKMLGYWDTVADRLYKIRHCMNIEGVVRQLALFEPPIPPGALVKAVAAGVDIGAALADLSAPLPLYRFNVLLQKANEVCNDVKALGSALLSALEKKDAEELARLRQGHEIRALEAVTAVREQQIEEAKENLAGLEKSKELSEIKKKYYESRDFMNAGEITALTLSGISIGVHVRGTVMDILGGALALVPDSNVGASGFGGSPVATVKTGGSSFSKVAELAARGLYQGSTILDKASSLTSSLASYQRRAEDWALQEDLATRELEQIDRQIAAAELRVAIVERELDNHLKQIEDAKATDELMRSKYTNQELYQWQVGQISGVYFQSYRLAHDLAKRAERCFRFELGLQDSSFIRFGYWDSLKKGLLAGEKLQYDLRRLDAAYLEQDRWELELAKNVSLRLLDPLALVKLRETGRCFFTLPEEIFDLDYPGHYFRRIKSVRLTLPCVTGPYTTISCTLRLLKDSARISTAEGTDGYPRNTDEDGLPLGDERFVESNITRNAIATSSGQNDAGVFELSFRDERYLPFEGAGVVSDWALELFTDLPANNPDSNDPDFGRPLRQFDYDSISDAILHVSYTAREDAGAFKNRAITHLREYFSPDPDEAGPLLLMLDLRRDFPTEWSRFLHPTDAAAGHVFELEMSSNLFPFRDSGKTLKIGTIYLLARSKEEGNLAVTMTPPLPELPPDDANTITLRSDTFGRLHFGQKPDFGQKPVGESGVEIAPTEAPVTWRIQPTGPGGTTPALEDLILVLEYRWD